MFKYKKLWIIIVISAMAVAGLGYAMKTIMDSNTKSFSASGYVLVSDPNANNEKVYFNENTKFSFSANDTISFNDKDNEKQTVEEDSYFHLANMFTTVFVDGVFMDLSETGNDYITHYQTESGAVFTKNNGSYVMTSGNKDYQYNELIWKLNDNRYIILGSNLKVFFTEEDIRDCGDYVELHYLDRGVVQIITEDNLWQTASTECFIETTNKVQVFPIEEKILNTESDRVSFLNTMVVNSDDNMHLRNDQELNQIIPKFTVITKDGEDGESGESGETGEDGGKGQTGAWGADAGTTSSSKTEIPIFNIVKWNVTATGISGAIQITDTNDALTDNKEKYSFFISRPNSDEQIEVVPIKEDGTVQSDFLFSDYDDVGLIYFKSPDDQPLNPDTEYILTLRGEYNMGNYKTTEGSDTESWINRDFIYRDFYTDSLGVHMSKNSATSSSLTIDVNKSAYSTATAATIFLLTAEQNLDFTEDKAIKLANGTITDNTIKKTTVAFTSKLTSEDKQAEFTGLPSNTSYIARILTTYPNPLNTTQSKQGLTDQELQLITLKVAPQGVGYPAVTGNRQQQAFEIYPVEVIDNDRAITAYRFTVYNQANGTVAKVVDVAASDYENMEYVNLYIDGEDIEFSKGYYIIETLVYNDNEKVVDLSTNNNNQIMQSSPFEMLGTALPSLSFRYNKDATGKTITTQYERIRGYLVISKNNADIKLTSADTIDVSIVCEGTYSYTKRYKRSDVIENNTEILIPLDENYLQQGKIYNISASAYVDVSDGNGYVSTVIGTTVLATPTAPRIRVEWTSGASTGNSIGRTVRLVVESTDDDEIEYVKSTLTQLKFNLYSGTASSGTLLGTVTLNDPNSDEYQSDIANALFTTGIPLSETYFNISSSSLTSTSYQFTVTDAYDYTINSSASHNQSGNICRNKFTLVNSESDTVGLTAQPPSLPKYGKEDECVRVTTITKGDAKAMYGLDSFGGDEISDDAIVGFNILANYDDYGGLARKVEYYGFEANYFYEQVNKGTDPEDNESERLFKVTLDIDYMNKGTIPSLVVWFGAPKAGYTYGDDNHQLESKELFYLRNQYMIYAGNAVAQTDSNGKYLASGMGRGYEYIFSYQMQYSKGANASIDAVYPTNHPNFQNWNAANNQLPALCLHSKAQLAPKLKPSFETVPFDAAGTTLVLKYRYSDPDDIVNFTARDHKDNSYFSINGNKNSNSKQVQIKSTEEATKANEDADVWEVVEFSDITYINQTSTGVNLVTISISESLYNLEYTNIELSDQSITVYETPWYSGICSFDNKFTVSVINSQANLLSNKLVIAFSDSIADGTSTPVDGNHDVDNIVGVLMTFTPLVAGTTNPNNNKSPLTQFVPLDKTNNWIGTITLGTFASYLGDELAVSYQLIYDTDIFGWGYKAAGSDEWQDTIASSFDSMFSAKKTVTNNSVTEEVDNPDYYVPYVALQETMVTTGFGNYLTKSLTSTTSSTAQNASNSYFRMYYYEYSFNNVNHIGVRNLYYGRTTKTSYTNTFDINYNNRGVIYEKNTLKSIVAKKLGTATGKLIVECPVETASVQRGNVIKIDSIVPTASYTKVNVTTDTATFTGFQIDGMDQVYAETETIDNVTADHKWVYLYIYPLDKQGSKITNPDSGEYQCVIKRWEITDADNGVALSNLRTRIKELTKDQTYQVEFKVKTKVTGSTDYQLVDLINAYSSSNDTLTATFTMEKLVRVRGITLTYENDSYIQKKYTLSYTLSQINDIHIEYTIEQKTDDNTWEEYLSNTELIARQIIVENTTNEYTSPYKENINLTPGIGGTKPLVPGRSYRLRIKVYSTIENGSDGKPLLVSEDPDDQSTWVIKEFSIPKASHPASMAISTPLFSEDTSRTDSNGQPIRNYGFDVNFTAIGDDYNIIMGEEYGEYCVRIYEQVYNPGTGAYRSELLTDTTGITVTSSDGSITSLAQLYSKVFKSDISTPKLTIWGLDEETKYKFSVYAALDEDLNGKNDLIENDSTYASYATLGIKQMLSQYSTQFNNENVRARFLLNEYINTTPNKDGVSIGYASGKVSGSSLVVTYYNTSGLERISKIVVSVVHESGSPSLSSTDGVIDSNINSVLKEDTTTSGKYVFTLPTSFVSLSKSGMYTVTIQHYNISNKLVYTYSGVVDK